MLRVELACGLCIESGHLKLVDHETVLLYSVDDLAHLRVAVGLDHRESSLALRFKISPCVDIAVVGYFEDTGKDGDLGANIEVAQLDSGNLLLLEEDARVLDVVHLD